MQTRPAILIVGGSDAGLSAALRIRELDPTIAPLMVLGPQGMVDQPGDSLSKASATKL